MTLQPNQRTNHVHIPLEQAQIPPPPKLFGATKLSRRDLFYAYQTLNSGHKRKLIFHLTDRGFGSEIRCMLMAILYCLKHKIEFRLFSAYWNGAYDKGWQDYFLPFCNEHQHPVFGRNSVFTISPIEAQFYKLQRRLTPSHILYTHDIWAELNKPEFANETFDFPLLGIKGNAFHAQQVILKLLLAPTLATKMRLASTDHLLNSMRPFVACHIRRGDKLIAEAKRIEAATFLNFIEQTYPDIKTVFIATDDYQVVADFEAILPPEWQVRTFCAQSIAGHNQSSFNIQSKSQRQQHTLNLLIDLHFLTHANAFVGTYSSNIGSLVAVCRNGEHCHSLDNEWYSAW